MIFMNHLLVICVGLGFLVAVALIVWDTFKSFWGTEEFDSDNFICIVIFLFLIGSAVGVISLLAEAWCRM